MYTTRIMLLVQQHPLAAHTVEPIFHKLAGTAVRTVLLQATLCRAVLLHLLLYMCTYLT
jgi:hypothetical protein